MYRIIDELNEAVTVNSDEELITYTNELIEDYNKDYASSKEAMENNPNVNTVEEAVEALKDYGREVENV